MKGSCGAFQAEKAMRATLEWQKAVGQISPVAWFEARRPRSLWLAGTCPPPRYMKLIGSISTCTFKSPFGLSALLSQKRT
ncbi:hypothetical protein GGR20_002128 [Devosia subaequoris]|uniref:Uncharacterized protein n=1 Tax=Devosia subaequoris TaxID=395930 RepID=A0A7W6IMT9_9HYPH|nr:hypothetical protein [Devosia subaequoris]